MQNAFYPDGRVYSSSNRQNTGHQPHYNLAQAKQYSQKIFDCNFLLSDGKIIARLYMVGLIIGFTIRQNIVLNEKYSESEFDNIIELCRLQDVINKHGKYSPIGLRAGGLSQGEIQKVSLARAFIRKPQILILDLSLFSLKDLY